MANEVSEIKWVEKSKIFELQYAFSHGKIINEFMGCMCEINN